jgi:outer membrane protein assembly factor BamB
MVTLFNRGILAFGGIAICFATLQAADWPQFRGPTGDGVATATGLPLRWGGFDPPTWQAEIPGRGWSSPIVCGERIWLTTAEQTALPTQVRDKKLDDSRFRDYRDQLQLHGSVTCVAVELSAATGEVLRRIDLFECPDPPPTHNTNGYASPTPATDGARLICHYGSLGTACVDLVSGEVLWKQRLQFDEVTGPGSSPVIHENLIIVPCDGADRQFVTALDIATGQTVWQTNRPAIHDQLGVHRRAFSTPLIVDYHGRKEVVVPGAQWVVGYNPNDGVELWRFDMGECHAAIPRPVAADGMIYVCTGYLKPRLLAIRLGGSGDITLTHLTWEYDRQVPEISSPIVLGKELYFVSSGGIATCLDARSGKLVWQHRLGGNFAASPLAADGKLYFLSREGVTTVVRAGREYAELAQSQLFGQTLASPAVCGQALLIRADRSLYCLGDPLASKQASSPQRPSSHER